MCGGGRGGIDVEEVRRGNYNVVTPQSTVFQKKRMRSTRNGYERGTPNVVRDSNFSKTF